MKQQQSGFTLIELVMVIVILGILAATALPKFADLSSDANKSALDGLAGALNSGSAITYAKCLVDTTCARTEATDTTTIDGVTVNTVYGYPATVDAGIGAAVNLNGGNFTHVANSGVWVLQTDCQVSYTQAASATATPTITVTDSGC